MPFIVDASATLPWCFEDEATPWTESILDRVSNNEQIHAPAHWPVEVSNGLLMATRRNRIPPGRAEAFLHRLFLLPISIAPPLTKPQCLEVLALCGRFKLTFYDATYLELALGLALPLATLYDALQRAGPQIGAEILKP